MGNLPILKKISKQLKGQHLALYYLTKKYNTNILGLKLGNNYVIVVSSLPFVRAILTGEEFEGRPNSFFIRLRCMGTRRGVCNYFLDVNFFSIYFFFFQELRVQTAKYGMFKETL